MNGIPGYILFMKAGFAWDGAPVDFPSSRIQIENDYITRLPVLFMLEGLKNQRAYVGSISKLEQNGRYRTTVHYHLDGSIGSLKNGYIVANKEAFGLSDWSDFSFRHSRIIHIEDKNLFEIILRARYDSEALHAEILSPAENYLLLTPGFDGARDEYQKAFELYRSGDMKQSVVSANNAFESCLKSICKLRSWDYGPGDTAGRLLKIVRQHGLLPDYLDSSFDQLAAVLKNGLPQIRSNAGGHGQGPERRETPAHVALYALHLAGASILFLARAHEEEG